MTPQDQPRRPLRTLTTAELTAYRRELERAIAFFDRQEPVSPVRASLQASLDQVIAEQDDREKTAVPDPARPPRCQHADTGRARAHPPRASRSPGPDQARITRPGPHPDILGRHRRRADPAGLLARPDRPPRAPRLPVPLPASGHPGWGMPRHHGAGASAFRRALAPLWPLPAPRHCRYRNRDGLLTAAARHRHAPAQCGTILTSRALRARGASDHHCDSGDR